MIAVQSFNGILSRTYTILSRMILHPDSMKIHKHQGQCTLNLCAPYFISLSHFILYTLLD